MSCISDPARWSQTFGQTHISLGAQSLPLLLQLEQTFYPATTNLYKRGLSKAENNKGISNKTVETQGKASESQEIDTSRNISPRAWDADKTRLGTFPALQQHLEMRWKTGKDQLCRDGHTPLLQTAAPTLTHPAGETPAPHPTEKQGSAQPAPPQREPGSPC